MGAEPLFSVIIPTYNRPAQLAECLRAFIPFYLAGGRFEIIVAQDGPGTLDEAGLAQAFSQLPLRLLTLRHGGPAAARNAAAAAARGRYLAFMDDDCIPAPDWLEMLDARLAQQPDSAIGGRTINGLPRNPFAQASQALIDYLYTQFNPPGQRPTFFTSNNLTVPAARFHELGGFDQRFPLAAAEDRDFCDRWGSAGFAMQYAPELRIFHYHHLKLRSFLRQHFNYGRGAYHFHQARAQRGSGRVQLAPVKFYTGLVFGAPDLQTGALLALTQLANAAGFFAERARPPHQKESQ